MGTNEQGAVTDEHQGWRYKHHDAMVGGNTVHGATATGFCFMFVPFNHVLRKATLGLGLSSQAGTTTGKVKRKIEGETAFAEVCAFTDIVTKTVTFAEDHVTEAAIFGDEVGPAMYELEIDGSDAGDDVTDMALAIWVQAIPPGPA